MTETTATPQPGPMLKHAEIIKIIPHRFPILLVDRAQIIEVDKKIVAWRAVSGNEAYFQGHFPGAPIMPGVLIVEAMAQAACILMLNKPEMKTKLAFFLGIDAVKFRKPVTPGDMLELRVDILRSGGRVGKARGEAFVNNEKTTEAEFTFVVVDKPAQE
jgi:beta-hydroxyacyl-ACP dehydratase FabZ